MFKKLTTTVFLLSALTVQAQDVAPVYSQEKPRYLGSGRVSYEGRTLRRPGEIEMALADIPPEAQGRFRTYRTLHGVGNAFGYLGGFGVGYGLSSVLTRSLGNRETIGPGVLIAGAGLLGLGFLLQSLSHRALRQTIDLYNQQPAPTVSFVPVVGWQAGQTTLGVGVRF